MPVAEELRPTLPVVTFEILADAVLRMMLEAARRSTFVSLNRPIWDGWVSPLWVRWRLPLEIRNAPFEGWDDEECDREAYWAVSSVMLALAASGRLEKRRTVVLNTKDTGADPVYEWWFRIPGEVGCCFWDCSTPDGPYPHETQDEYDQMMAKALASRQVVMLQNEMGGALPPYALARVERYARQHSRKGGTLRVSW